jgi:hypothetical protein
LSDQLNPALQAGFNISAALAAQLDAISGANVTATVNINTVGNIPSFADVGPGARTTAGGAIAFHDGGTVPGSPGQEVPATLQAGEEVIATGEASNMVALLQELVTQGQQALDQQLEAS